MPPTPLPCYYSVVTHCLGISSLLQHWLSLRLIISRSLETTGKLKNLSCSQRRCSIKAGWSKSKCLCYKMEADISDSLRSPIFEMYPWKMNIFTRKNGQMSRCRNTQQKYNHSEWEMMQLKWCNFYCELWFIPIVVCQRAGFSLKSSKWKYWIWSSMMNVPETLIGLRWKGMTVTESTSRSKQN